MAKYLLTNKAVEDLAAIWEYTYRVWSERQADKYYELLTGSFLKILSNPRIGRHYEQIGDFVFGLRIGSHIIFYELLENSNILIVRILHQRMDLKNRLTD